MRLISACATAPEVSENLLAYLETRLQVTGLEYQERPVYFPDGWETYIFRFQLAYRFALPPVYTKPLFLRVYASRHGWSRLRHEYAVHGHVRGLGYQAPRPLLLERNVGWFGGPFMLMEAVAGRTMLSLLLNRFPSILWAPAVMARAQARLHLLPAAGFPDAKGDFLERRLAEIESLAHAFRLPGLLPGLDWLAGNRPQAPRRPSIVHLDFHPGNLIFLDGRCQGVLDWCEADVADRHADLAASLLLIESTPLEDVTWLQRAAMLAGRSMLRRRYLRAYRRVLPVDAGRLRYYLAWATLRRLCRWGTWLRDSPLITGSKPSAVHHLTPDLIGFLENYFQRQTAVTVRLGARGPKRAFSFAAFPRSAISAS